MIKIKTVVFAFLCSVAAVLLFISSQMRNVNFLSLALSLQKNIPLEGIF